MKPRFSPASAEKFVRLKVSLAVTFSAWTAAVVAGGFSVKHIPGLTGVLLLACGASALNQVQEEKYDSLMERTSQRPIPSGSIGKTTALIISVILLISGSILLSFYESVLPVFLGLFNIFWYNGLYTFLKRKTAFAVIPGSLTGAIPILMGWTIAGASLSDAEPWFIAIFIFMWQIPHFWLLILKYGVQYEIAGLPSLSGIFSERQMKNIIFSWIMGASAASMMLTISGIWNTTIIRFIILILNFAVVILSAQNLFFSGKGSHRHLFIIINVFMLIVMLLIVTDRIL